MTRERIIRLFAGSLVLISLALGLTLGHWWFALTAFVGLNLFQSALTGWCLLDDILRRVFHLPSEVDLVRAVSPGAERPAAGRSSY